MAWSRQSSDKPEKALFSVLDELIQRAAGARLVVRSDDTAEAAHPGRGTSTVVEANAESLAQAMEDPSVARCALVQVAIEPAVLGLMSNERRVSAVASEWLIEGELSLMRPELHTLPSSAPAGDDLHALTPLEAFDTLAAVASRLGAKHSRLRVEWLWDGSRVWIVQADQLPEPPPAAYPPGPTSGPAPSIGQLSGETRFVGYKVSRWRVFERLGWRRPQMLVITGDRWHRNADVVAEEVRRSMSGSALIPWVARTDIHMDLGIEELLLPTSPPTNDPVQLLNFMGDTATQMTHRGLADDCWALLIAPMYPCLASAWAHAGPDSGTITVDALWGFPDGLLHLPHDSYEVGPTGSVSARVRFKPACVIPEHGQWTTRKLSAPYDWERPLDDNELRAVAELARELAGTVGGGVDLMVLARVGARRGTGGLLPFHFTLATRHRRHSERHPGKDDGEEATLTGPKDLEALDEHKPPYALRVEPETAALRDAVFLRRVGAWASKHEVPIVFAGSVLGHAFHLLAQDGAPVLQPSREDSGQEPEDLDRRAVIIAYAQGLERVRVVPRCFVQTSAAMTLARLAATATAGPRATRALTALMDLQVTNGRGEPTLDELGRIEVDAVPETSALDSMPLFMDEGFSGHQTGIKQAGPLAIASLQLPVSLAHISPLDIDVPGGRVSVSSSRQGSVIVTVTPTSA